MLDHTYYGNPIFRVAVPLHYQTPGEVPSFNRSSVITAEDIARLQPVAEDKTPPRPDRLILLGQHHETLAAKIGTKFINFQLRKRAGLSTECSPNFHRNLNLNLSNSVRM